MKLENQTFGEFSDQYARALARHQPRFLCDGLSDQVAR